MTWPRATRKDPCPICNKPDWCEFTPDRRRVMCMRVESKWPTKSGGFMHLVDSTKGGASTTLIDKSRHPVVSIDCRKLLSGWRALPEMCLLESFAATLNVSESSLRALGCVYAPEHRAFAFPMYDAERHVIGIRLRNDLGKKWAVKGSKQGLFLSGGVKQPCKHGSTKAKDGLNRAIVQPDNADSPAQTFLSGSSDMENRPCDMKEAHVRESDSLPTHLLIVEGPTDAAAAFDLGFDVIGRPACLGCENMIVELVERGSPGYPCIIADSDGVGQRGAQKLHEQLRRSKVITLPCKDLREFKNRGGTKETLECIIKSSI